MKQSVDLHDFRREFESHGRAEQFSYEAQEIIFNYLEELGDDIGEEVELDVIAICCDYSEEHYTDIASNYNIDLSEAEGDGDAEFELVMTHLNDNTSVLGVAQGKFIVYQPY